jgi:transcriptional regulator with XRE-family HTH domain
VKRSTRHPFSIAKPWKTEALRLLRGPFSLAEFAALLGVQDSTIQKWESGTFSPSMSNLRAMLKHYQTWTNDLAGAPLNWLANAGAPPKGGKKWQRSKSTKGKNPS